MAAEGVVVGTVAGLARFPVKSMGGETLEAADLHWTGIEGDRSHGFVRTGSRSDFPWLTGRQVADLVRCRPCGEAVALPGGDVVAIDSRGLLAWLEAASGEAVHLMRLSRGMFDAMPVSVASTATLAAVAAAHGAALDWRRFRFNVVIESGQSDLGWRSGRLAFGDGAELLVSDGIPRCAMITIDPQTGERDPRLMRTVVQGFDNILGVYAATARPGRIRVGDVVRLIR